MTYHQQKGVVMSRDCFKILRFVVMQRVARICQRQRSYLLNSGPYNIFLTGETRHFKLGVQNVVRNSVRMRDRLPSEGVYSGEVTGLNFAK